MGKEKSKGTTGKRKVTFIFEAKEASSVALMGDFNDWNEKVHPMKKYNNELWKKSVFLKSGRYEYRFLVDGEWQNDPGNRQVCPNRFGTYNNYIIL
jgi:1,4-alpha-glucan branching enzyme